MLSGEAGDDLENLYRVNDAGNGHQRRCSASAAELLIQNAAASPLAASDFLLA